MSSAARVLAGVRDAALLPVWSAQLLTSAKSFQDNPLIGSQRLNARGLHVWRVRTAARLAQSRRARLAGQLPQQDRETLDRDGFLVKRDFLPGPAFRTMLAEVRACHRPAREMTQGDAVTRRIPLDGPALASMPSVAALLRDPRWRGPIRYAAASAAAPMVYLQAILSHAAPGEADPQVTLQRNDQSVLRLRRGTSFGNGGTSTAGMKSDRSIVFSSGSENACGRITGRICGSGGTRGAGLGPRSGRRLPTSARPGVRSLGSLLTGSPSGSSSVPRPSTGTARITDRGVTGAG